MGTSGDRPAVVVFSSLFPSSLQATAGVFVRERMFRVGKEFPLCVLAPSPWFPFQNLLRRLRPHFRPAAPRFEVQSGFDVWYPRYFSFPGLLKRFDGFFMALGAYPRLRALRKAGRLDLLDAHFGYPDGYAASLLGRWLNIPVTITLRGTESRHAKTPGMASRLAAGLSSASRVFSVADALKKVATDLGIPSEKIEVVGNGVDTNRFRIHDRHLARARLDLPLHGKVLISVGGLVERKGYHRVIEVLPTLLESHPDLVYLIVGGSSREGNMRPQLEAMVAKLGLHEHVRFLGPRAPEDLAGILSAADIFVLATRNEGWANVFLEAMACGLPVVTTDVGGNREVVSDSSLGIVVPFGDARALTAALQAALIRPWNRAVIRQHAKRNCWDQRIARLCSAFLQLHRDGERSACAPERRTIARNLS